MAVELIVVADIPPRTWEDFLRLTPGFSIALDGAVRGGPRYDDTGPHRNFNHHEDVDRLATRATCAQVLMDIRQGLFDRFRADGEPHAHVYVNDCDEDVCTSWFLLSSSHLVEPTMNPLLNRLVAMEDSLDATAGAYPFPRDLPALQELAWVFAPYRQFRMSGALDKPLTTKPMSTPTETALADYRRVIEDVSLRIGAHVTGRGDRISLDTNYERVGGGSGWTMVREYGPQARTGMFADGVRAFVSVRDRLDGGWTYSIGRMSDYIRFPLPALIKALDHAEAKRLRDSMGDSAFEGSDQFHDKWGGGSTIGGSPRVHGSHLPPDEVESIIERVLAPRSKE
jgi:hypothetical protein